VNAACIAERRRAHDRQPFVSGVDWPRIEAELDAHGVRSCPGLLSADEMPDIAELYILQSRLMIRVIIGRHGFGPGRVPIFLLPLRPIIHARLRSFL